MRSIIVSFCVQILVRVARSVNVRMNKEDQMGKWVYIKNDDNLVWVVLFFIVVLCLGGC